MNTFIYISNLINFDGDIIAFKVDLESVDFKRLIKNLNENIANGDYYNGKDFILSIRDLTLCSKLNHFIELARILRAIGLNLIIELDCYQIACLDYNLLNFFDELYCNDIQVYIENYNVNNYDMNTLLCLGHVKYLSVSVFNILKNKKGRVVISGLLGTDIKIVSLDRDVLYLHREFGDFKNIIFCSSITKLSHLDAPINL